MKASPIEKLPLDPGHYKGTTPLSPLCPGMSIGGKDRVAYHLRRQSGHWVQPCPEKRRRFAESASGHSPEGWVRGGLKNMRKMLLVMGGLLLLTTPSLGQGKRLWVLRSPGEMVEYDPSTFAAKLTVKVPAEAIESPGSISVNRLGQILYEAAVSLPLSEEDAASAHKVWFWNGRTAANAATIIDQGVKREVSTTGSNQAVTESAPVAYLSADGGHLFWFA